MTLSNWVLDYVFRPVMAVTRNPVAGLFTAILAIGLWHDFSLYYVLWSCWQTLGVVLARVIPTRFVSARAHVALAPVYILGWLSLARPIIALLGVRP
jgi:D-alanyl-lipoteichoic acid acyltransferase DltB (MBOAT superfamily)